MNKDRRDITEHHRSFWCRCGRSGSQCNCCSPINDLSVVALINQGYGVADIGMMFGVSCERARQIAYRQGRKTVGSLPRVWDDRLNQFRAITRKERDDRRSMIRRARRRSATMERQRLRRIRDVAVLRALVEQLGRVPTQPELKKAIGKEIPAITQDWGRDYHQPGGHAAAMARLYEAAGLKVRRCGYTGWVANDGQPQLAG